MARKRGGVAGLWDRNKGWLQYVAPAVVGAIPGLGPLAAAGLGAAMGGLDRPGKGGIGVDVGGAVRGGITGYGAGSIGKSVSGGIGKMFNPAGAAQASAGKAMTSAQTLIDQANRQIIPQISGQTGNVIGAGQVAGAVAPVVAPAVAPPVTPPPASPPPPADTKELTGFAKYLDVANKNAKVLEMIGKGVQSQLPNPQFQLQQQQYEEQLRQQKLREERQAIMARLLIPLLAQQQGKIPPQSLSEYITGYGPSGYNNMA